MGKAAILQAEIAGSVTADYRRLMWFTGRMRRRSFWLLNLGLGLINLAVFSFSLLLPTTAGGSGAQLAVTAVQVAAGWLGFTSFVRRLHDIGLSGWWLLLVGLVSVVSRLSGIPGFESTARATFGIAYVLVTLLDGMWGTNRFGKDPRDRKPSTAQTGPFTGIIGRVDRWTIGVPVLAGMIAMLASVLADRAVQLLPRSWLLGAGEAEVAARIPSMYLCPAPAASAALKRLAARLEPTLQVRIVFTSHPYVKGLAVPGGIILIGQDVVRLAQSPDEVAGLMAHELAHVRLRHTEQMLLTTLPQALLPRMLGTLNAGLATSYSRAKEREADALAARTMLHAGIDPRQIGVLLTRLDQERQRKHRRQRDNVPSWLSTHPSTPERIEAIGRTRPPVERQPAMTGEDWAAIRNGCNRLIEQNPSVRSW